MPNAKGDVLVVEDDPDLNQLVGAYAEISGFRYRSAADGTSALREVHQSLPSVILLDLMLPDIDGFEVCRRLKSEAATAGVPVIFLTAMDRAESRSKGMLCGAADYLTKPFDPDCLMAAIRKHAKHNGHAG